MPFLSAAIRDGTHRLGRWEALAPSMTSAGQAGILHGNNAGIPAFRWWEKDRGYLMVSNHPDDAWLIEQRASGPHDLLARRRREHLQPGLGGCHARPSRPTASCPGRARASRWTGSRCTS